MVARVGRNVPLTPRMPPSTHTHTKWSKWEGNVYRTVLPDDPAWRYAVQQMYVDGEYVPEARWPDAPHAAASMLNVSTWATMKKGSGWGKKILPSPSPGLIECVFVSPRLRLCTRLARRSLRDR